MKSVYDLSDSADRAAAGQVLASIVGSQGWAVLHQLLIHIRERDIGRKVGSADAVAELNGRLTGMKALLSAAEELAKAATAQTGMDEIKQAIASSVGTGAI